jgi:hypothetical protein
MVTEDHEGGGRPHEARPEDAGRVAGDTKREL